MKTLWEFRFQASGMVFNRERKFTAHGHFDGDQEIELSVLISPDREVKHPQADDAGKISVTLPGRPEENKNMASAIVHQIARQISFPDGRITVLGGLVTALRIAENEAEEKGIEGHPYLVELRFTEVPILPEFDPKRLSRVKADSRGVLLLDQFNSAKELDNPVDQFLGMFKVIEKAYSGRRGKLLRQLKQSDELFLVVRDVLRTEKGQGQINRLEFAKLLATLVKIRDNCAHLRGKTGYAPGDLRTKTELEPYLPLVRALAQRCVESQINRKDDSGLQESASISAPRPSPEVTDGAASPPNRLANNP